VQLVQVINNDTRKEINRKVAEQQLITSDDAIVLQKKTIIPKPITNQEVKHPDVEEPYAQCCSTYDKDGFLKIPYEFIKRFRRTIKTRINQPKFPLDIGAESNTACEILDILLTNGCKDAKTADSWMRYYASTLPVKPDFYITLQMMKRTWDKFNRIRRKPPTVIAGKKPIEKFDHDIIGDEMKSMLVEINESSIKRSLQNYGVVLTANYMKSQKDVAHGDVVSFINCAMGSLCGNADKIRLVFEASCRYDCSKATNKNLLLSDWKKKYAEFWKEALCKNQHYEPSVANIVLVDEFFRKNIVSS